MEVKNKTRWGKGSLTEQSASTAYTNVHSHTRTLLVSTLHDSPCAIDLLFVFTLSELYALDELHLLTRMVMLDMARIHAHTISLPSMLTTAYIPRKFLGVEKTYKIKLS
jgi:hypothetical protein